MLKANMEVLFVGKDDNSFLENYSHDLYQDFGDKSGEIFVNLEVQNNPVDAEEIGGLIFETMRRFFFEGLSPEPEAGECAPYERFEAALKEVNKVLKHFKSEKKSGYIGNLNIIVAAIVGNNLLLTQCGDAEAYLIRKRFVSIVSEGLSDESSDSGDVFLSIANGQIEEDDFVLFSSTRLLRYISKTDLAKAAGRGVAKDSLDEIQDIISTEILGKIGLTGILFKKVGENAMDSGTVGEMGDEAQIDAKFEEEHENMVSSGSRRGQNITGRFLSVFKRTKRDRPQVFHGESGGFGLLSDISDRFSRFFTGIFSKGFGKDKILALLILVILVLIIGIGIAKDRSEVKDQIAELEVVLSGVQSKIAEAETKSSYDKESAKVILDKAYAEAMTVLNSGQFREKAKLYLIQIEDIRDNIDDVQRIEDVTPYIDLTAKRSDVNALGFVEVGDRVFVYEYNALYELVLDQVQEPITIDEEEIVISATGFDDRNSVVFLTKSGKLIEYLGGTVSFMDTDDGAFHKGAALEDWSNRVYILDDTNGQVWRYTYKGNSEKFGSAEGYISSDEVDLTGALDIAIDSNVYVLQDNGDIFKFYAGSKVDFYINNLPFNSFINPTVLYTNEKLDEVFVLDPQERRVFVFTKDRNTRDLVYKSQYLFGDDLGDLRDLYVDADALKMYVLTGSKVYEVGM